MKTYIPHILIAIACLIIGFLYGTNREIRVRLESYKISFSNVFKTVESNTAHLEQLETEWGYNARVRADKKKDPK